MSSLAVQRLGAFTAYANPASFSGDATGEDLTSVSQAEKTHDPFGLRKTYERHPDVISVLDKIDEALVNFNPNEDRYLDLHRIDFRPLSCLQTNGNEQLHLERLLIQSQNIVQYPLCKANFEGADLREAILKGAILTRAILRDADLRGADLNEAQLTGADFTGADLRRAWLRNACVYIGNDEWLTGKALRNYLISEFKVVIDEETRF